MYTSKMQAAGEDGVLIRQTHRATAQQLAFSQWVTRVSLLQDVGGPADRAAGGDGGQPGEAAPGAAGRARRPPGPHRPHVPGESD